MPRSRDAEEGLLAPAQPTERCGPKAKKTSLAAVAVATIVVAAVVFIKFVAHSDSPPAETPEVPDTPDDPDQGLEMFHCETHICKSTKLTGGTLFKTNDCNNTCTPEPEPSAAFREAQASVGAALGGEPAPAPQVHSPLSPLSCPGALPRIAAQMRNCSCV